ncbi:type IV secretion system protein [Lysobacter firmicutimachus]|uniref:Type IV secretion system protein n=1 Tax=Lysobacter firmicutimachus TaxID=1792846 RepID=A0ABU8D0E7_9GAMM
MDLLNAPADLMRWLSPTTQSGLADYALFRLISGWIGSRVDDFGLALMGRMMGFVGGIGLGLVTLWILFQGYRVLTGQLRDPLMGLVVDGLKIVLVFAIATTMAFGNIRLNSFLTNDMDKAIHQLVTGKDNETTSHSIDKSLAIVQVAMTAIDGVQLIQPDPELLEEKRNAKFMATMGSAAPAIAAGTMLLLWKFVIALWVGLGPLFIFALAFPATKGMFIKWLQYGLGTLFSMAVLSFVANLLLDLTVRIATFMWLTKLVNIPGLSTEGITNQAMQQGSVGMIMTMLIVSVPPIAAHFFQGQVGSFLANSSFGRSGQGGSNGQSSAGYDRPAPRGLDAPQSQVEKVQTPNSTYTHMNNSANQSTPKHENRIKSPEEVRKDQP